MLEYAHVITDKAEGEDCYGQGVTGAERIAIEETSEGFVVVFYGRISLVWVILCECNGVPERAIVLKITDQSTRSAMINRWANHKEFLLPECGVEYDSASRY